MVEYDRIKFNLLKKKKKEQKQSTPSIRIEPVKISLSFPNFFGVINYATGTLTYSLGMITT